MARLLLFAVAAVLLIAGTILGYISLVALRRSEGVFLPAGYVSLACLGGGLLLIRAATRS